MWQKKFLAISARDNLIAGYCEKKKGYEMSFLSEMVARRTVGGANFSLAGKIRAGVKVPTTATKNNSIAMEIVSRVEKGELSFQNAATEIGKKCGIKNPFFPKNTQHFHAHPWDMESGEVTSRKLLELYGEIRNDQSKKLYRFPVVFPDIHKGGVDSVLGSGLAVRGGSAQTIHYKSQYGDDGVRRCVYFPPIIVSHDARRKQFAPRTPVVRGQCETDICPQYASGECRFAGVLKFYIPGIPGAGIFQMETGSTQAATEIYLRLAQILEECGGVLPNFTQEGEPVFWLTKAKKTRIFYEGETQKKVEQWVPILETQIDMAKVAKLRQQQRRLLLSQSSSNVAAMPAPAAWIEIEEEGEEVEPENVIDVAEIVKDSALVTLLAKAEAIGIGVKTQEWAALRFGEKWQEDAASQALELFAAISHRFQHNTGIFLDLQIRLLANKISFKEVEPYFRKKMGGISGENLIEVIQHLDRMLEQGREAVLQQMQVESTAT